MQPLSLDTNALISAWGLWYSPQHHDFFDGLLDLAKQGLVLISEEVYDEVHNDADLHKWMTDNERWLKVPTDGLVTEVVIELTNKHKQAFVRKKRYADAADPYVIAVAKLRGAVVITDEAPSSQRQRDGSEVAYSIPAVCIAENIPWAKTCDVIKLAGWRFRLDRSES